MVIYLCCSEPLRQIAPVFTLTAKLDVGGSADDGAAAVDGQTLIWARVSSGLGAADHQAPRHQGVARVQAQRDLCAVHQPPARQWAGPTHESLSHRSTSIAVYWRHPCVVTFIELHSEFYESNNPRENVLADAWWNFYITVAKRRSTALFCDSLDFQELCKGMRRGEQLTWQARRNETYIHVTH